MKRLLSYSMTERTVRDLVVERRRRGRLHKLPKTKTPSTTADVAAVEGYTPKTTTAATAATTATTTTATATVTTAANLASKKVSFQDQQPQQQCSETAEEHKDQLTELSGTAAATVSASTTPRNDNDDNNNNNNINKEPLILNSIAELFDQAGTLPPDNDLQSAAVIEAGLEFSCMDPHAFQELRQSERDEQYRVFMGAHQIPDHDDDNSSSGGRSSGCDDEEGHDENYNKPQLANHVNDNDTYWDLFDGNNDDDDDSSSDEADMLSPQQRPFLILWNAIAQWVTPQAVSYVRHVQQHQTTVTESDIQQQKQPTPTIPRSDVAASRCAGLMAMLKMHTATCLQDDLHCSMDELRQAEQRLANLLRLFDFEQPMPKHLDTAMTRALTCILLDTVLCCNNSSNNNDNDNNTELAASCQRVGLSPEEYRYLTKSAIVNFGTPDDDDDDDENNKAS